MVRLFACVLIAGPVITACFGQQAQAPILAKAFGAVSIGPGTTTTLTFNLSNPNTTVTLTGLGFTDNLPAGLLVATPNGLTGSCGGGAITATAGSGSIVLAGATLAAGASCTFRVAVTATGSQLDRLTNTTGSVATNQGVTGGPASASIFIGDPFQISYFSNLNVGDSFINITNTGARGADLPFGTSASVTGAICVNAYAFEPDEQLFACCSCPVTPNGLVSFSIRNDFLPNTLFFNPPTSMVVKLVATAPVGGSCVNSAASLSLNTLAPGMAAWGTKIHNFGGTYGGTETAFTGSILSAGELDRLNNLCNFIFANGSGFGICRGCRPTGR